MKNSLLGLLAICSLLGSSAAEQTVYDNTDNYQAQDNETLLESGDQVRFAEGNRVISSFAFEYFSRLTATPSGNEKARVRFYLNDGSVGDNPSATPGTVLYDSGTFTIGAGIQSV